MTTVFCLQFTFALQEELPAGIISDLRQGFFCIQNGCHLFDCQLCEKEMINFFAVAFELTLKAFILKRRMH